ncbi:MAG: ABC transporter substrate-binding protein [Magnetococcales bacterium]|nr:ABC transporter substrate-binding protein [Magnetococcales bacterium]
MRNRSFVFLIVVFIIMGGGYVWTRWGQDRPLDKVGSVSIGASLTLSPVLVWIAQDQGFFTKAGLDATVKQYSSGKTTTEGMLSGEVDLSASAEFLAVRKSFVHDTLRILGTTAFVHQIQLLGLREQGITSVGDFKGKRVGVRLGTNGEFFLARLLTLNGMVRDDITWVNLPPQKMADALAEGVVDGILVWPPFVQHIQQRLGDRVVAFDGQPGQDYYYLLLCRQEWLSAHPVIAQRVMLAMKQAEKWIIDHPEAAQAYMAKKFDIRPEVLEKTLAEYRFKVSLPQMLLTAMEAETRWLEELGHVQGKRVENFLDLIDFKPLLQVAPQDVTVLR